MTPSCASLVSLTLALCCLTVPGVAAQGVCSPDWEALGGGEPGVSYLVYDMLEWDDGTGDGVELYVAGDFKTAGGVAVNRIARWTGSEWEALGAGFNASVHALAVHDDGGGEALYAAGSFVSSGGSTVARIGKWDGATWTAPGGGINGTVWCLASYDDGSGAKLYAGGTFTSAGGVTANHIARWDGSDWWPPHPPLGTLGANDWVWDLEVYDAGSGPELYAAGDFTIIGGTVAPYVARWNGVIWSDLAFGPDDEARVLEVYDGELYVAGSFGAVGSPAQVAPRVARWDGGWSTLGTLTPADVDAMEVFDAGSGPRLYMAGSFGSAGGVATTNITSWDGSSFAAEPAAPAGINCLAAHDDGSGPALYAGGFFDTVDGDEQATFIGRMDGTEWDALSTGLGREVFAVASFNDGSGSKLYVGGRFLNAAGEDTDTSYMARWTGSAWESLGAFDGEVRDLIVHDDGIVGPRLYACGSFQFIDGELMYRIARWDGDGWTALQTGLWNHAYEMATWDDGTGPGLYVVGQFSGGSGVAAAFVAKWDGTSWSPLGSGLNSTTRAITVHDDGGGSAIYVAGQFTTAGGSPASRVAKWDGTSWSPLGLGVDGTAWALASYGGELFIGGGFDNAGGGVPGTESLARWTLGTWFGLPATFDWYVYALQTYHDGTQEKLYLGGFFSPVTPGGTSMIAAWNGFGFENVGSGLNGQVDSLSVADTCDGSGPALYIGGRFTTTSEGDSHLGVWRGCWDGVNNWTDLGFALAGAAGEPEIVGEGPLAPGSCNAVHLGGAAGSATCALFLALESTPVPFFGGTLVPFPFLPPIYLTTSPFGMLSIPFDMPFGIPTGTSIYVQYGIVDAGATAGVALSNALRGDVP